MPDVEQTIATPLEDLEFVIQSFNQAAGVSIDKVIGFMPTQWLCRGRLAVTRLAPLPLRTIA